MNIIVYDLCFMKLIFKEILLKYFVISKEVSKVIVVKLEEKKLRFDFLFNVE